MKWIRSIIMKLVHRVRTQANQKTWYHIINYNSSKLTTFRQSVVAAPTDVMVKGNRRIPIKYPLWAFVCSRFRFQTSVDLLFEFTISAYIILGTNTNITNHLLFQKSVVFFLTFVKK